MSDGLQLGYLVVGSADTAAWDAFLTGVLGVMPAGKAAGVHNYRIDDRQMRVQVQEGDGSDLGAVGLVATNPASHAALVGRLAAAGVDVTAGSEELCARRRVAHLVSFTAPGAIPVELAHSPLLAAEPFHSAMVPRGFVAGTLGLGHVVLMVDDIAAAKGFWIDVMGFALSDESFLDTPSGPLHAAFLHCNRRHHSVAVAQRPARSTATTKLLHFMVQAADMDAVGMAFDRAIDAGLHISRSLGRHPNDRMFSFYASTPGNFDYEMGWGAVEVGEDWEVVHYDHISAWGHRNIGVLRSVSAPGAPPPREAPVVAGPAGTGDPR